ncbi:Uncharacterised protein [Moraxella caviae]|uniref:Uncharacterized protein n=1 Tax=Moraxella caviae TaxID=34060 RepID=A0A378R6I8_9GAMM|nr:Uncharacterised protein [Moraxella caviae]VEW10163.1 Uncharacterised protein [Moraxella caviae]
MVAGLVGLLPCLSNNTFCNRVVKLLLYIRRWFIPYSPIYPATWCTTLRIMHPYTQSTDMVGVEIVYFHVVDGVGVVYNK